MKNEKKKVVYMLTTIGWWSSKLMQSCTNSFILLNYDYWPTQQGFHYSNKDAL